MSTEENFMKMMPAEEFVEAPDQPAQAWFALRVAARRPSVASAPLGMVRKVARPAIVVDGKSGIAESRFPCRAEFLVQDILLRAGIGAWVPVRSVWNRANKYRRYERVAVYQPLLPGCVLAALPLDARGESGPAVNWARVLACPLVQGVMGIGGVPAPIPLKHMNQLRGVEVDEQAETSERLMPTGRAFGVGQEVEILRGPLREFRTRVLEISPDEAKVILELFGRAHELSFPLGDLGAVE